MARRCSLVPLMAMVAPLWTTVQVLDRPCRKLVLISVTSLSPTSRSPALSELSTRTRPILSLTEAQLSRSLVRRPSMPSQTLTRLRLQPVCNLLMPVTLPTAKSRLVSLRSLSPPNKSSMRSVTFLLKCLPGPITNRTRSTSSCQNPSKPTRRPQRRCLECSRLERSVL